MEGSLPFYNLLYLFNSFWFCLENPFLVKNLSNQIHPPWALLLIYHRITKFLWAFQSLRELMVVSHDFLQNPHNCNKPDTLDLQGQHSLTALKCVYPLLLWKQGQNSILFLPNIIRELSTKPVQNFCIIWDETRRGSFFSRNFVLVRFFYSAEPKSRIWIRGFIVKSPLLPVDFPIAVQPNWADGIIHLFFFFELRL